MAIDSNEARLKLAQEHGADVVIKSGPDAAVQVRDLANGIKVIVDRYAFKDVKQGYDDFEHGKLVGRAVITPNAA